MQPKAQQGFKEKESTCGGREGADLEKRKQARFYGFIFWEIQALLFSLPATF